MAASKNKPRLGRKNLLGLGKKVCGLFERRRKNLSGRAKKNFERHVKIFGRDGQEQLKKILELGTKVQHDSRKYF